MIDFEASILNCGSNGTWHDCPDSNYSTFSHQFQYTPPPVNLIISNAYIVETSGLIVLNYYSNNYAGNVSWEYTSLNGTATSSDYVDSYYRTTYFYASTYGLIEVCGTIIGDTTCVNLTRNGRDLSGQINHPFNNTSTPSSNANVSFTAGNYSTGFLEINNQTFYTLHPNSTGGTFQVTVNVPLGWSTICLRLTGDNGSSLVDCIQINREAAIERLFIDSLSISAENNYVIIEYHSENYSGLVNWTYTSSTNTSSSSSYVDYVARTTTLSLSTYGPIQVCGTIGATTECASIIRTVRMIEGGIISLTHNHDYNESYTLHYYANNYSSGVITLNGANYISLGTSFGNHVHNNSTSVEVYLPYGTSTVCLELDGDAGTELSPCITIQRLPPTIPCGNSSTLTFTNTSTGFDINDPITFTVIVQCGVQETDFILRGDLSKFYGSQSWNYSTLEYFQHNSNGQNTPYGVTFTYYIEDTINSSGDYIIQLYIGEANNIISSVSWNFTIYGDNDADGINDLNDNCVNINNANQLDLDGDGLGDACDDDIDGDGVLNQDDALPNDTNESIDTDGDGIGNNADSDDDGDGMDDLNDAFPLDPTEQADLDSDGVGDNIDADDDADGITDVSDNCPLVSNADQADFDNDGIGTVCDGMELIIDDNGTISDDSGTIPSLGVVGTLVSLSVGLLIAIRRENEE